MPNYTLNWTTGSSAIQGWQRCHWCSSSTRKWPSRSWGPFGIKSAMEHWPSGMDARQSADKPLHEAVARRAFPITLFFTKYSTLIFISRKGRIWHKSEKDWQRLWEEGRRHRLAEHCYIDSFLTQIVIPYSGAYIFASLTRSSISDSKGRLRHRAPAGRSRNI